MNKARDKENKDLQEIINGLARVASGDFSTKIKLSGDNADLLPLPRASTL